MCSCLSVERAVLRPPSPSPRTAFHIKEAESRKSPCSAWFWCISPKSLWLPRVFSCAAPCFISGRKELIIKFISNTLLFNLTPKKPRHLGVFGRIMTGGAYKKVGYGLSQSHPYGLLLQALSNRCGLLIPHSQPCSLWLLLSPRSTGWHLGSAYHKPPHLSKLPALW